MGGAFALTLLMVFFWMPESAYVRKDVVNIDTGENSVSLFMYHFKRSIANISSQITVEGKAKLEHLEYNESPGVTEERNSWTRELLPYSGHVNHVSFWNTLVRPFYYLVASPVVLWATILFTTCISWLVLISLTLSQIFSAPPYNFSVGAVGATNVASFVASLIGTIVAGPLVDGVATRLAKLNKGTFGAFHSLSSCPCTSN